MNNGPLESKSIGCPRFAVRSVSQPVPEKVNFPVEDYPGSYPVICGGVPGNIWFAVADKDAGFMAKLLEALLNYLRNRSV